MNRNEEDVVIACGVYLVLEEKRRKKRVKRYWIHNLFRARDEEGEFNTIFSRLKEDPEKFISYFRMSYLKFNELHLLLQSRIQKKNTRLRNSIPTLERLALTIR